MDLGTRARDRWASPSSYAHSYEILLQGQFIQKPGNHDTIKGGLAIQCENVPTIGTLSHQSGCSHVSQGTLPHWLPLLMGTAAPVHPKLNPDCLQASQMHAPPMCAQTKLKPQPACGSMLHLPPILAHSKRHWGQSKWDKMCRDNCPVIRVSEACLFILRSI